LANANFNALFLFVIMLIERKLKVEPRVDEQRSTPGVGFVRDMKNGLVRRFVALSFHVIVAFCVGLAAFSSHAASRVISSQHRRRGLKRAYVSRYEATKKRKSRNSLEIYACSASATCESQHLHCVFPNLCSSHYPRRDIFF